jgi:hypothetical protein
MKTISDLFKLINITEDNLISPIETQSETIFAGEHVPENSYIDNGRADIITKTLKVPFIHDDRLIVGYTLVDKYSYGREMKTWKKYTLTIYYSNALLKL